jgi:anthranilate synthase/indole-3-glycerol phosphate synthase/phosphoribosylanthranilate isomerase
MRVEDALVAREAGADFVGLMFARDSRRLLTIEDAQAIVEALGPPLRALGQDEPPPLHRGLEGSVAEWFTHGAEALGRLLARKRPLTVGVFEDQSLEEVNTIADETGIDLVQLGHRESWAGCLLANRQVIKTVDVPAGVTGDDVVAGLEAGSAIACLLDASRGRGIAVDRATAASVAARLPVWLAGGLTPENVSDVVRDVRPWLVDVSSGVETDGAKDARKIRAFVQAVGLAVGA